MKKKAPLRWDKIIGFITVVTIVWFGIIIYGDFNGNNRAQGGDSAQGKQTDRTIRVTQQAVQGSASAGETQDVAGRTPVVCIDAGHGGTDGGAEYHQQLEKAQTLTMAVLVKQYLEERGVTVVMTRTADVDMELEDRVKVCNQAKAAAMISIHRNFYEKGTSVSGVESWIHSSRPANSTALSEQILAQLKTVPGVTDRGVKAGTMNNAGTNYYINAHSSCASCVLELGFINNAADQELVTSNKEKTAKAISEGIIQYLKNTGYQL